MKEIWILNHYASATSGRHYNFARLLNERGYSVKLFAASTVHGVGNNRIHGKDKKFTLDDESGVPCIYVRTRGYSGNGRARIVNMVDYAVRLMFVSREFDSVKPDVIYASSVHPLTWLSGYFLAKRYKARFVAETRDLWPETLVAMGQIERNSIPARVLYWLERFIYTRAERLVFTFPGGKDYVKSLGIETSKVTYINNGVDIQEFMKNKERYVFEDADLEDPHTFKVVYAGSMGQANALQYVVQAAEIIQSQGINDVKFLLFGDGYQRQELEDYAKQRGLSNIVFKGRLDKKFIPSVLDRANLNIISGQHIPLYKYGLSPNKMFEYFASGKPTISNIECCYDILEKYGCGVTVKGGSAEALARGVLDFYNMPEEIYNHFGENALVAAKDFDFRVLVDKLEAILLQ